MHFLYLILAPILIFGLPIGSVIFVVQKLKEKALSDQIFSAKVATLEARAMSAEARSAALEERYKDVSDLDSFKVQLQQDLAKLQQQSDGTRIRNQGLSLYAEQLRKQIDFYTAEQTVVDCGLYAPVYDFDISQRYKDALDAVREKQKVSLKGETAAVCPQSWTVDGSLSKGRKQTKAYTQLMLRAFNGESDALIANVRWSNVQRMIERLEGVYKAINKLGESHTIYIQRDYFQLKLNELKLTYEYQEKLKAEKDELRRVQEKIREDERAQRELDRQVEETEEEERRSQIALNRAKQELQLAQGAEVAKLGSKIEFLERQLAEALANKERAKSMAQMTKCGHVYVISNIGSFGENRFKIGMTRRFDPTDRVDELSNASVPFEFDIHAMIYSENAPQMEAALHDRFNNRRINLVNRQKEFFECSIDEIAEVVKEYNADIEFIKVPEAKNYRQSVVIRSGGASNGVSSAGGGAVAVPTSPTVSSSHHDGEFYIFSKGTKYGPLTHQGTTEYVASGQFSAESDFFWREGMSDWLCRSINSGRKLQARSTVIGRPASGGYRVANSGGLRGVADFRFACDK